VRLAVVFACLLLFAGLVEKNILFPRFNERHAQRIQKIFTGKEQTLLRYMDRLGQCAGVTDLDSCFIAFQEKYADNLKKHGLYLFLYRNDTLDYWSTKDVAVPETWSSSIFGKPYVSLGNDLHASGKYASFVKSENENTIVGLVLIKNVHFVENKYLKTAFHKDFKLPANVKIFHEPVQEDNYYPITDSNGQFVWSLIFDTTCFYKYQIYLPALVQLLAIIVFFLFLDSFFGLFRSATSRNLYLPVLGLILAVVRLAMQHRQIPEVFYKLEDIFSPVYFGSQWFPSLGELGLWCLFISFFVFELFRFLRFPLFYERRWKYFAYLGVSLMAVIVAFFAVSVLLKSLVINSSDIFEGNNRILLFHGFSLLGYAMIMLFLTSFCLLLDKMIQLCKQELTFYQFLIIYIIILSVVVIGWSIAGLHVSLTTIFFLSVLIFLAGNMRLKKNIKLKYQHYTLLVFILALFTSIYINRYNNEKYESQKKLVVTNRASQQDLTAEFLLRNISERIVSDTILTDLVYRDFQVNSDFSNVRSHLTKQYFYSSYWNRYRFQCVACDEMRGLSFTGSQRYENCVSYFMSVIDNMGTQLMRSDFYFIDRPDVSYYLGWFRKEKEGELPLHLFIEFYPGISDEVGYPELLLDDRLAKASTLKNYSYAKYINNRKVTQSGDYRYNLTGDIFQTDASDYHTVDADGMEHLVYRPDKNNMIVLSSYSRSSGDQIINFSYIFIIFFVVVSISLLIFHLPVIRRGFQWNFRNKIQYSMIAVMMGSFTIIGFFTVDYVNRQKKKKNIDIVNEKMRAIHAELQGVILHLKNMEGMNQEGGDLITGLLMDYQGLFFAEVNLFDVRGQLIATSFPDIFDKGLTGRQINPEAYIKLALGQRASIIEYEDIGGMNYISAYEPFVDNENRVFAFLNLSYFTQQDALTEEISSVIMTLLNFYMVIILLTVIISVVMSNQITRPLMMLQDKFRNIRLGAKNDPILYSSRDELGGLVKEYNRAIEELARSANRLARSERELAWREMAKQLAHEINNPLTPMKLSVQHLKRAYDNNSERFDEYMEKISRSLVEQIDTLSDIATEFSNFAKMPVAQNERMDLIEKINNVVPLFAIDENKQAFHTDFHGLEHAMIFADKEQISRVFINLFKNALQAMPKGRQAEICIDVQKTDQMIWVNVKDNGMGIPEEMQEKIFRPNFTTKSSGMGMGLSIVRSIIKSVGGTISFKTRRGEGTTFMISLPEME
jgi:signal transduction histidine kinase